MQLTGSVRTENDFLLGLGLAISCSLEVKRQYQKYCSEVSSEAQYLPRWDSFAHSSCKSIIIYISTDCNPELRNREEHDIIPPLLPSSGNLSHYNLDKLKDFS